MSISNRFSKCDGIFVSNQINFFMKSFKIKPHAPYIYSEDFIVRSYHVDLQRKLTLPKLCSFFQDIAGNHTVACGVGWDVLQQEELFWVLSRLHISVKQYPLWEEKIKINTWSNGLQGLMAIRHFQVLDNQGNELVRAISSWVMVSSQTRRIVRADEYMRDFPLNDVWLFDNAPGKIDALSSPLNKGNNPVQFTETDMNFHMNNVSYIERIMNSYDFDFLTKNRIHEFEINFLKEAVPGDNLSVEQQQLDDNSFLNSIVRASDNADLVRTKIEWGEG